MPKYDVCHSIGDMSSPVNFRDIFFLLREWFDTPTPRYDDFDRYRFQLYDEYSFGYPPPSPPGTRPVASPESELTPNTFSPTPNSRQRLPLKIWWPHLTSGDYRFELCIGALLVHQTSWRQVEKAIRGIEGYLTHRGEKFTATGAAGIPLSDLEELVRSTGFFRQKARRLQGFSQHVVDHSGTIDEFMTWGRSDNLLSIRSSAQRSTRGVGGERFGSHLRGLGMGFGNETRDSVLLYAANIPVFIADAYARKLLGVLGVEGLDGKEGIDAHDYNSCQRIFGEGIRRDFSRDDLQEIISDFTPEERDHALVNSPPEEDVPLILLYQVYHAAIDELGISKRWDAFREELQSR